MNTVQMKYFIWINNPLAKHLQIRKQLHEQTDKKTIL